MANVLTKNNGVWYTILIAPNKLVGVLDLGIKMCTFLGTFLES
jgi:hypothetical protein